MNDSKYDSNTILLYSNIQVYEYNPIVAISKIVQPNNWMLHAIALYTASKDASSTRRHSRLPTVAYCTIGNQYLHRHRLPHPSLTPPSFLTIYPSPGKLPSSLLPRGKSTDRSARLLWCRDTLVVSFESIIETTRSSSACRTGDTQCLNGE